MPQNIPQHRSTGNVVVDEFIQRGFVKVDPGIPRELLRNVADAINNFPQPDFLKYSEINEVNFGLLNDKISMVSSDNNLGLVAVANFENGFMAFNMHAQFLEKFTDLYRYVDTFRPVSEGARQRMLPGLVAAEYTDKGTFKVVEEEGVVVAEPADPLAIFAAEQFKRHDLEGANGIAVALGEVMQSLDYLKYLDFSMFSGGIVLGATKYEDNATTFSDNTEDPHHVDLNKKNIMCSINVGTEPRKCIIGRTKDTLEVIWQQPGEILFLDNEGTPARKQPIHLFNGGMSGLFSINGINKRAFMRDEMSGFAEKFGWKPTVAQPWRAGETYTPPDIGGR